MNLVSQEPADEAKDPDLVDAHQEERYFHLVAVFLNLTKPVPVILISIEK